MVDQFFKLPARYWAYAGLVFSLSLALATVVVLSLHDYQQQVQQREADSLAELHAQGLQDHLIRAFSVADALAGVVRFTRGEFNDFERFSAELLRNYPGVLMVGLAPGGVVDMIAPLEGNAANLGRDLFADPQTARDAWLAVDRESLTISSLVTLADNREVIVGRVPVFVEDDQQRQFWGLVSVLVGIQELSQSADLQHLQDRGYGYRVLRFDSLSDRYETVLSNREVLADNYITGNFELPNSRWQLRIEQEPDGGLPYLAMRMTLALLVSLLLAYLMLSMLRVRWQREHLEHEVALRTAAIEQGRQRTEGIIRAIPDLLFELDLAGTYLAYYSHPERLEAPFGQLRGRTVSDVMPAESASRVMAALREANDQGWSTGQYFQLPTTCGERWYELSVARKPGSEPAVFVVLSRDITQRIEAEQTARDNLARYEAQVSATNTGAWEYDTHSNTLYCNDEYFVLLGMDPQTLSAAQRSDIWYVWVRLIHPLDQARAVRRFVRYMRDQSLALYEDQVRVRHADGHWVWLLVRGRYITSAEGERSGRFVGTVMDFSEQVAATERLRLTTRAFEQSTDGFLITDAEQRIVMVNKGFTRITGYPEAEVLGKNPNILSSGRHNRAFYQRMWRDIDAEGQWQGEVWNRRKDGSLYPEWLTISSLLDEQGQVSHYLAVINDITQRKQDEQRIYRLAYYDSLTELPNRPLLEQRAAQAFSLAARHQSQVALLYIDLDNFKNVNDSLGHEVGDTLLVAIARRLQGILRDEDTLARSGGDEFMLLLPEVDANGASQIAEHILQLLADPIAAQGHELVVTASIGIALYPDDALDLGSLHTKADIAMYRAKALGRNAFSFFTPALQTHYVRTLEIENALRRALELDQLSLNYQPQHELATGRLLGFEALLRWQHPELGQVSPAEFIPVAENSGLILPIGDWVIEQAMAQLGRWHAAGHTWLSMAINLSAAQFNAPDLAVQVASLLRQYQLPAGSIELELTETIAMQDPDLAVSIMQQLHQQGIRLALDDFGTGYSSLSYLKRYKLQTLKIDQSFIRYLSATNDDAAIVNVTINLAKSLGMQTLAEGVETREQLDFLRRQGCDIAQGYLLSRPLPAELATTYITSYEVFST
ncbi:bifunctional diguanylate cyclase/phosphodiesterase [Halopseudomonas salegens]|uniref:cyclic-guanylate-specific phosphodiesterase n=1 Tax=Halopseudomonas salegens TaxID=1434072 RepID=A0A1H2HM62_9GAMM|nr:EAL domain-containing protein [Halopseudomonas salegens]SDU32961.1 PAS domain S-box-containing protein/diguanylate cyclase (GGDEF) domain-containing protein [Halopseudomonas salegens]